MLLFLVCSDGPPERTYDNRFGIKIIDKNGLDNSAVPITVKCDTCDWSIMVPYGEDYDGVTSTVAQDEAEQHRLNHEREADGKSVKSANKAGVTNLKSS